MAAPAPRFSWITLLTVLSIISAVVLAVIVLILTLAPQSRGTASVVSSHHITTAQTASGIDRSGAPTDATSSFAVGQTIYLTYTVTDAGPGAATLQLFENGSLMDSRTQSFDRRSTYNAYFVFQAPQAGNWEADLFWRQAGGSGPGALEQRVPFVVGSIPDRRGRRGYDPTPGRLGNRRYAPLGPPASRRIVPLAPAGAPELPATRSTGLWNHCDPAHSTR